MLVPVCLPQDWGMLVLEDSTVCVAQDRSLLLLEDSTVCLPHDGNILVPHSESCGYHTMVPLTMLVPVWLHQDLGMLVPEDSSVFVP